LIYDERGDFEHAIEDYDRAIKYGSTLVVENRAMTRYQAGEYEQAVSDFSTALNREPADPFFYAHRGLAHAALGETAAANTDCDHAISSSPTNAHLHDVRGVAHTLLGDLDNASRDFATALTLDPKFARSYFDRGTMHTRRQNYDCKFAQLLSFHIHACNGGTGGCAMPFLKNYLNLAGISSVTNNSLEARTQGPQ
jgi:tetratricopeptide (TPR) repeat protein